METHQQHGSYEDETVFRKIQLRRLSEGVKGNIKMDLWELK
jgi:hypothetical protein